MILLVRNLQPGQHADPDGAAFDLGAGGPAVPATWASRVQTGGWYILTHPSGRMVAACHVNDNGAQGLFGVDGDPADLAEIANSVPVAVPAREAWRRRNEAGIKPYLRWWRILKCSGARRVEGAMEAFADRCVDIVPIGVQIPDWESVALPWHLAADGSITTEELAELRVDAFSGADTLCLGRTMLGAGHDQLFADEPDPGA